jgi:hypothetical protein
MDTVEKGRLAMAHVKLVVVEQGWAPYLPAYDNGPCDMIVMGGGVIKRIEVKYASRLASSGSVEIALRQVRHNTKGSTVKHFDAANADSLAAYLAPFRCVVFFHAVELDGKASLTVSEELAQDHYFLL